jgi:hypothetical protein
MWHAWGRGEVFAGIWLGGPEGRDHWVDRRRWEDDIKMDLREIGIGDANWIRLAQDKVQRQAFMSTLMKLRVP